MGLNDKATRPIDKARLDDRREEPGEDLQPRHGHALVLEGPRARPRAVRPQRDGRRGGRADGGSRAAELEASSSTGSPRPRGSPRVMIDPDGIHRAVLNIVTNAIDAAEGKDAVGPGVVSRPRWDAAASMVDGRDGGRQRRRHPERVGDRLDLPASSPQPKAREEPASACPSRRRSSASTAAGSSSPPRSAEARPSRSSSRSSGPTSPRATSR